LGVEEIIGLQTQFRMPEIERRFQSLEDIEKVALELRKFWQIGLDPIENLVEIIETQGIKVGIVQGADHFDALTLMANGTIPVIVVKDGLPGDRQRLSIAHELGHLILELPEGIDEEKAAFRFAGAFLVPEPAARRELGDRRQRLDYYELHMLKHKYGMSMQAWIHRANDLNILSSAGASSMYRRFSMSGWKQQEPGDTYPSEKTDRLERLVMRTLTEELISEARAEELLGTSLKDFWKQVRKQHDGLPLPIYH
jgi:Zn-dependent peptidase ImmA (M78 family)